MISSVDFGEAQTDVGCRFFDEDGNFVGSRVTSNTGAGSRAAMFFVAIVRPQNAFGRLFQLPGA